MIARCISDEDEAPGHDPKAVGMMCSLPAGREWMRGQAGFWDIDERYARLSEAGDPWKS